MPPFAPAARAALAQSLTQENIAGEVAYLQRAGPCVVRAALWTRLAAAALRRVALLEGPAGAGVGSQSRAARERSRRAHQTLAAGFVLSDSRRRTRSDRVFIRPDLGLGRSGGRCGDAQAARGCGAAFLRRRPQLPVELRTVGTGFSFAVPRRSRLHAPSARSRGIHSLADNLPAGDPEECARRLAADGGRDQSLRPKARASRWPEPESCVDARRNRVRPCALRTGASRRWTMLRDAIARPRCRR